MSAAVFDILRNLGYGWAAIGTQASVGLIFGVVGLMAASLYFCPESNTLREAWSKLKSRRGILLYQGVVFTWAVLTALLPNWYLPLTVVVLSVGASYPTMLFWSAGKRAKPAHVKNAMKTFATAWSLFLSFATTLLVLGAQPPVLPVSLPYAWEFAIDTGSVLFFSMSLVQTNLLGPLRMQSGQIVPNTIVKPGHTYLILHDSGKRAIRFLSSTLKGLIDSGARIIIKTSPTEWLVRDLSSNEPHFSEWRSNGRVVISDKGQERNAPREGISQMLGIGPTSTVYISELEQDNLQGKIVSPHDETSERGREESNLFLLESRKAPRRQLTEFLRNNTEMELLNLSESTDSFSSLIGLDHQRLHGSIILLEYDNNTDYEGAVDKFLSEGMSNAELCVLFTAKSSALYRLIKGRKIVRIIAASSLLSAPEELPDGEMQIPDKELGLVAAIASDFIDNSKNSGVSFVFDSISDLIRGERWEQIYSGIRQLIDLLTVPNATALFLANTNTMDPRFLGALRGSFALQLRLDADGFRAVKIPQN
jgi:hypothetical protein